MSEWSANFEEIVQSLKTEAITGTSEHGLLHALVEAWMHEDNCLIWLTLVPGENIFGSTVIFVNNMVLQELQWDFSEWEDGTAALGVFREEEANRIKLHLDAKSRLPVLAHVRKKNTPQNQEGKDYILHFHYDLPHNLRLTVGVLDE